MILQRPTEIAPVDTPESRGLLAADLDTTADLPFENTEDLTLTQRVETTPTVDPDSSPVYDTGSARLPTVDPPSLAPMPEQSALGFFSFAACALIAVLVATLHATESPESNALSLPAAVPPDGDTESIGASVIPAIVTREAPRTPETLSAPKAAPTRKGAQVDPSLGIVAFQSRSFVTSEQAVTAVFILKRTQAVRGRAVVHWAARSGSADAGIDFSDASGAARFADGQRQVAIYVPLRNDLLKEADETFKVCLRSPRQARIGGRSCAEVTILDDDDIAPT